MTKPQPHSNLCFGPIGNMLTDPLFQQQYLELLFDRLRPLKNAGVPKPDPMTFDLFISTFKRWNQNLFEQWKTIVVTKYCSSPEVHAIHGYTTPLFPRYMYHVALNLEESEGLERYTRVVLALKKYLESHGKSVSEELRRHPLADMAMEQGGGLCLKPILLPDWEPKTAGKSRFDDQQLDYYRYIASDIKAPKEQLTTDFGAIEHRVLAQEQLNENAAKLFKRLTGESLDEFKKRVDP